MVEKGGGGSNPLTMREVDEAIRFIYGDVKKSYRFAKKAGLSGGIVAKWKQGTHVPTEESAKAIRELRKLGRAGAIVRNCLIKHGRPHEEAFFIGKEVEEELAKIGVLPTKS